jgi:hypothetical protein
MDIFNIVNLNRPTLFMQSGDRIYQVNIGKKLLISTFFAQLLQEP